MVSKVSFFNMEFKIRGLFMNISPVGIKGLLNFLTLNEVLILLITLMLINRCGLS